MFNKNKFLKIVPLLFAGLLFLILGFLYNQNRDSFQGEGAKAQELMDVTLVCEGDEIPLGELIEDVLGSAKIIVDNSEMIVASASDQATSAQRLSAMPDECKAENCNPGCTEVTVPCNPHPCVVGEVSPGEKIAGIDSNIKKLLAFLNIDITSFSLPVMFAQAACDPAACALFGGICCADTCIAWWEDENNCGACGNVCPPGSTCDLNIPGDYTSGASCWGTCWDTCTECRVSDCTGDACPWSEISSEVISIRNLYNNIAGSQGIIESEMEKRDDYLETLEEVREKLGKCVTPSLKELSEPEVKEAKVLYTCKEAKYQRALPSGKEDCDHPANFVCCYFK